MSEKDNQKLKPLNCDPDARRWADEFNGVLISKGEQPYDPGWLIGWFANAIMCGKEVQRWKMEAERDSLKAEMERLREALEAALPDVREGGHASDIEGISVKCPDCSLCIVEAALFTKGKETKE